MPGERSTGSSLKITHIREQRSCCKGKVRKEIVQLNEKVKIAPPVPHRAGAGAISTASGWGRNRSQTGARQQTREHQLNWWPTNIRILDPKLSLFSFASLPSAGVAGWKAVSMASPHEWYGWYGSQLPVGWSNAELRESFPSLVSSPPLDDPRGKLKGKPGKDKREQTAKGCKTRWISTN